MTKSRLPNALLGLGYFALAGALIVVAMMAYNRSFVDRVDVTLETGSIGNALQTGSDVKLHGVPVGEVTRIETAPGGATVTLALDPATAESISATTTARLLPKTLFGERYVSLVPPAAGTPASATSVRLAGGDTIRQDASDQAVELEQVLDQLLPLLKSIQPEKLSATLGELSTTLRGQGADIGDSLVQWKDYLTKLNPLVPTMTDDLAKLGSVATTYSEAVPDLLSALDSLTVTSKTIVNQRTELTDVYTNVITSADTTTGWVGENQQTIEVLADQSRKALEAAKPYAAQFPCLFKAAKEYIPVMDRTLGKGTAEPGIHVQLNVVKARGKYLPGKDKPSFETGGKARCPYVTGRTGARPASTNVLSGSSSATASARAAEPETIAPPPKTQATGIDSGGLGDVNSPAENQLLAELLAPTQGLAPAEYPAWSSLLLGPTLRDTKVTLQ